MDCASDLRLSKQVLMRRSMPVDAVLIAGPTASGKSAAALALAERLRGVVINADSMQVYSELRILTARPTPEDEARAPHLFMACPCIERYSAGRYQDEAAPRSRSTRGSGCADLCRRHGALFRCC